MVDKIQPGVGQFRTVGAPNEDRILSKRGEVKVAGTFHKGQNFKTFSETVLRQKYSRYFQENIKTHLDLKQALLNEEKPETALLAFSLLDKSGYRGEPLTGRKVLEVVSLLEEVKIDDSGYKKMKGQFDTIAKDPRMQACLEIHYPGKMDGFGAELLEKIKDKAKGPGVNAAVNLLLPGVGLLISTGRELHKASVNGDAEAHHHQLEQISQLPGRDQRMSLPMEQALATGHAKMSVEGGVGATLGMATGGLGTFGITGVATAGVTPLVKEAIGSVATTAVMTGGGFAASQAGALALNNEASATIEPQVLSGILPRLEVSNSKGDFTFSMQEAPSVRALMTYLGPRENTELLLSPDTPKEVKEMEQARLELKAQLGSRPGEHLVPDTDAMLKLSEEDAPSEVQHKADKVFKKLLAEDYGWLMPAVSCLDKGKADEINAKLTYKLPLDAPNGRVMLDKSPNLKPDQIEALKQTGTPSQLRLMYIAEGWI